MPRHRLEVPSARTLGSAAAQSARRVPVRAASGRATPSHAKPAAAPEWRQRLTRSQRRMLKQAGHRLVVSPWFAAGAGVVIATGAVIYMPHADMSFGGAISVTHCKEAECSHVTPNAAVPLQVGSGEQVTAPPSPPSVLAGMTFTYQVLDQSTWDGFSMQITVRAPRSVGQWKLSFAIPGATDVYVLGARWVQSGPSGGTASNYYGGTESAGYAAMSGNGSGAGSESGQDDRTVQFQVRGTGTPSAPADCFYDGVACQFQRSVNHTGGNWPASG